MQICASVPLTSPSVLMTQDLVDDDRAETVWGKYSRLLYPRGAAAVLDGEELYVGKNIVRLGGKRYFLQVSMHFYVWLGGVDSPVDVRFGGGVDGNSSEVVCFYFGQ